jgi:sn-glycerol 3-phosphate transport system permease protein
MKNEIIAKKEKEMLFLLFRIALGLVILFPLFICFSYSMRPDTELMNRSRSILPEQWSFEHYRWVFRYVPVFRYMMNSFICCVIVIFFQLMLASFAAYAFSFFNFPGKKLFFTLIITTMMIPGDVTIITNFLTIQNLGLKNTYAGFTLPFLIGCMAILLMRQFYLSLPSELKEAATIDGCGDMGFLFKIAIPLSKPSMISLAIYEFIGIYNQYFWPLLVSTDDKMHTIQIGMSMLMGHESDEVGRILAGAIVCIIPSTIVFIVGQKPLVSGMIAGSIKG